jgi:HlyD family secretion protein
MTSTTPKDAPDVLLTARDPALIERQRRILRRRRWVQRGIALAVVLGIAMGLALAARPRPVAVELATAKAGRMQVTIDEAGRTRVRDRFVVHAPLAGDLARIDLRPGDKIENGQVLAQMAPQSPTLLDPRSRAEAVARLGTASATLQQARANQARAEVALDHARSDAERLGKLAASGSISRNEAEHADFELKLRTQEMSSSKFTSAVAASEVQMAKAALSRYGSGGKASEVFDIVSPIGGRVLKVMQASAATIAPSTPLMEVGDPTDLEVVVDVLTEDAVRVPPGAKVNLDRWGGPWPLAAHVRVVEPSAFTRVSALGVEEQRVAVIIDLDDPVERRAELGDGYRVEAHIVTWQGDNVLTIPSSAAFRQGDGWATFVAADGRARLRMVELGHRSASEIEITRGLTAGDVVIVHPSDSVRDGARVATR